MLGEICYFFTYLIRHLKIKLIILPILDLGNVQLFGFIQFTFGRILYQEKYIFRISTKTLALDQCKKEK